MEVAFGPISLLKPDFPQNFHLETATFDHNTFFEIFKHAGPEVREVCHDWKQIFNEERLKQVWSKQLREQFPAAAFSTAVTYDEALQEIQKTNTNIAKGIFKETSLFSQGKEITHYVGSPQIYRDYILFSKVTDENVKLGKYTPTLFELWDLKAKTVAMYSTCILFKEVCFTIDYDDRTIIERNLSTEERVVYPLPQEIDENTSSVKLFATENYLFVSYKTLSVQSADQLHLWYQRGMEESCKFNPYKMFFDIRDIQEHPLKAKTVILQDRSKVYELNLNEQTVTTLHRSNQINLYPLSYLGVTKDFILAKGGVRNYCDLIPLNKKSPIFEGEVVTLIGKKVLAIRNGCQLRLYDYIDDKEVCKWEFEGFVVDVVKVDKENYFLYVVDDTGNEQNGSVYLYSVNGNNPIQSYQEMFHSEPLSPKSNKQSPTSPVHKGGILISNGLNPKVLDFK